MSEEKETKYYLGLDIGTTSVGWCLTDQNYNIVTKKDPHDVEKRLWGVRMFDEAKTCKERRQNRTNRRRLKRRNERLKYLRDLFEEAIFKIDPTFFDRLKWSFFHDEDKDEQVKINNFDNQCLLFNTKQYSDSDFYKDFPTIFHLKKALLTNTLPDNSKLKSLSDPRLLYLAIHNTFKHRGNFLHSESKFKDGNKNLFSIEEVKNIFKNFNDAVKESTIFKNEIDYEILNIQELTIEKFLSKEKVYLESLINTNNKKEHKFLESLLKSFFSLFRGGKSKLSKFLSDFNKIVTNEEIDKVDDENLKEYENDKLSFESEKFEEYILVIKTLFPHFDTLTVFLVNLKVIYDCVELERIMRGKEYISEAYIKTYENFKTDLRNIKDLLKNDYKFIDGTEAALIDKNEIKKYFDGDKESIKNYIGGVDKKTNKRITKKTFNEEITKATEEILKKVDIKINDLVVSERDNVLQIINDIRTSISENRFLVKPRSSKNGIFPFQLNRIELNKILEVQKENFYFINDDFIAKINQILSYKVDYFVGPFNSTKYGWVSDILSEDFKDEKITPFNYDLLDKSKAQTNFIERMTSKCSVFKEENVLARQSITYQKFVLFNNLLNLIIDDQGVYLSTEVKQAYINSCYMDKKVTKNQFLKKLNEIVKTSSISTDINFTYASLQEIESSQEFGLPTIGMFYDVFKKVIDSKDWISFVNRNVDVIDEIVRLSCIFNQNLECLESELKNFNFQIKDGTLIKLTDDQIKMIKGYVFKNYGKFSKKFLTFADDNGNSVMSFLLNKDGCTLSNILNDSSGDSCGIYDNWRLRIKEKQNEVISEYYNANEFIDDLYVSPSSKRAIRQTHKIIDEIERKIFKDIPNFKIDKFFVEVTRDNRKKKTGDKQKNRTKSLYEQIKTVYDKPDFKKDYSEENFYLNFQAINKDDEKINSKKLRLYFKQLGKCMYSLEEINYGRLNEDYEIDHIVPRSLYGGTSYEDGEDNLVLVKREKNQAKADKFPIKDTGIIKDWKAFEEQVEKLRKLKLISKDKKNRLLAKVEDALKITNNFIDAQLTTTNQSTSGVIDYLRNFRNVPNQNIIFSKAHNVTQLRKAFELPKSREANNFHHAHDALLNVVAGDVLEKYYMYRRVKNSKDYEEQYKDKKIPLNPFFIFRLKKDEDGEVINPSIKNIYGHEIVNKITLSKKLNTYMYEDESKNNLPMITWMKISSNEILSKVTLKPKGNKVDYSTNRPSFKYGGLDGESYIYALVKEYNCENPSFLIKYPNRYYLQDGKKIKRFEYIKNQVGKKAIIDDKTIFYILDSNSLFVDLSNNLRYRLTGAQGASFVRTSCNERIFNKEQILKINNVIKSINFIDKYAIKEVYIKRYDQVNELLGVTKASDKYEGSTRNINGIKYKKWLSKEDLELTYNRFSILMKKSLMPSLSSDKYDIDVNLKEFFYSSNLIKQIVLINELIKLYSTNSNNFINLTLFNDKDKSLSKTACKLTLGKNVDNLVFIEQSPTGFFEKKVKF